MLAARYWPAGPGWGYLGGGDAGPQGRGKLPTETPAHVIGRSVEVGWLAALDDARLGVLADGRRNNANAMIR